MQEANQQKIAEDVSERAHQMPRGSALLYRNRAPKDTLAAHYRGMLKLENGQAFWVGLWIRRLGQERVLEVKLAPKT